MMARIFLQRFWASNDNHVPFPADYFPLRHADIIDDVRMMAGQNELHTRALYFQVVGDEIDAIHSEAILEFVDQNDGAIWP